MKPPILIGIKRANDPQKSNFPGDFSENSYQFQQSRFERTKSVSSNKPSNQMTVTMLQCRHTLMNLRKMFNKQHKLIMRGPPSS